MSDVDNITIIPGKDRPGSRRSKRTTARGDEDMLEKAKMLAAKKNLDNGMSNKSFASMPFDNITSNISKLGVSMGTNSDDIMNSVISIKNIEVDRLTVAAKKLNSKGNAKSLPCPDNIDDQDDMDALDAHLTHICRDLSEVLNDEGLDQICYDLNAVPRKKKSNSIKRQSKIKRPSKKPITPSKLVI